MGCLTRLVKFEEREFHPRSLARLSKTHQQCRLARALVPFFWDEILLRAISPDGLGNPSYLSRTLLKPVPFGYGRIAIPSNETTGCTLSPLCILGEYFINYMIPNETIAGPIVARFPTPHPVLLRSIILLHSARQK